MTVSLSPLKMSSGPPGTEVARSLALVRNHDKGLALTAALIGMLRAVHRSPRTPLACLVTALVTMLVGACAGVPPGLEKEWARTEAAHWDFDMCVQAHVRNPSACSAARAAYDRALKNTELQQARSNDEGPESALLSSAKRT